VGLGKWFSSFGWFFLKKLCSNVGGHVMKQLDLNSNPEGSLMAVSANREDVLQLEVWNEGEA
jgi:hypothetical protein